MSPPRIGVPQRARRVSTPPEPTTRPPASSAAPAPPATASGAGAARRRGGAGRGAREYAAGADHAHARVVRGTCVPGQRERGEGRRLGLRLLLLFFGLDEVDDAASDVLRGDRAGADGGEHVVGRGVIGGAGHVFQDARGHLADAALLEQAEKLLPPEAHVVLAVGLVEELPNLVPRPPALNDREPVPAGPRVFARYDLDPVP